MKTLAKIMTAAPGWPRLAFGAAVLATGATGIAYAHLSAPPLQFIVPAGTALVLAGMAVRVWIGEASEDDGDDELVY